MPNWVTNRLSVRGDHSALIQFQQQLATEDSVFSFTRIIPRPEDKEWYENNWLEFNIETYGVKWDCSSATIEDFIEDEILYQFETPWSPVVELMAVLSSQYPHLEFMYDYEEEQGWGGEWVFKAGGIGYQHEWDIPSSHKDFIDHPYRECHCVTTPDEWEFKFDDCPVETVGA
jgi:hypothetical protein